MIRANHYFAMSMLLVSCAFKGAKTNDATQLKNEVPSPLNIEQWKITQPLFPTNNPATDATMENLLRYIKHLTAFFSPYIPQGINFKVEPSDTPTSHFSVGVRILEETKTWLVSPYGSLEDAKRLSQDVMTYIVCHEMGHFYGGYPFHSADAREITSLDNRKTVSASEGQADYFATKDCLPRFWAHETQKNSTFALDVDPYVKNRCEQQYSEQNERNLCFRIAYTSWEAMKFMKSNNGIAFHTPNQTIVSETAQKFNNQTRLDVLLAGALCPKKNDLNVIPGLIKSPNGLYGEHSVAAEKDSERYSCTEGLGARPMSWFKAGLPDIVYHDCSAFGETNSRCFDQNTFQSCHKINGIYTAACTEGCIIDSFGPTCKEWSSEP